ncbi:hypothetical protein [Corynebacterium sp. HMSC071B10]|uniref:hypothetical protein n=1 Tax=Corynebacterium sp. HMSC071B10 TaxID=1739494 RepID=UPI00114C9130|nr:hypothetical protein [Corynebacterium sp. HMSC071B10]
MTIMHNHPYSVATSAKSRGYRGYPVAEWDLMERELSAREVRPVRTLNVSTPQRTETRPQARYIGDSEKLQFESRREKRESVLVGIGLGIALILGSAIGGVFSPEQSGHTLPTEAEFAFYAQH